MASALSSTAWTASSTSLLLIARMASRSLMSARPMSSSFVDMDCDGTANLRDPTNSGRQRGASAHGNRRERRVAGLAVGQLRHAARAAQREEPSGRPGTPHAGVDLAVAVVVGGDERVSGGVAELVDAETAAALRDVPGVDAAEVAHDRDVGRFVTVVVGGHDLVAGDTEIEQTESGATAGDVEPRTRAVVAPHGDVGPAVAVVVSGHRHVAGLAPLCDAEAAGRQDHVPRAGVSGTVDGDVGAAITVVVADDRRIVARLTEQLLQRCRARRGLQHELSGTRGLPHRQISAAVTVVVGGHRDVAAGAERVAAVPEP